ncbi:MAG: 23S rRNA (uracil(1939)-C(5))-methyltransferase RlmD [Prevotellaceae bacterium]|jgi:23S rRNA (uracil1939-C5)-methyltransferase|nr:23S rRNA (uracil(1939)-C(5))-methyltransferase RlmD [Prevotellaceae bacterium]
MGRRDRIILENVLITGVAAEGKALASIDGKILFVPHAIPGDVADIQVTHRKKAYMEGYILNLRTQSPDRIPPFCPHYGYCGGCKWQPLPYPLQLKYKQQQVYEQLTRIGKCQLPSIKPIIASEKRQYYRNKLEFTFSDRSWLTNEEIAIQGDTHFQKALGFHVSGSFDKVLDITHCYLQPDPSNAIRLAIKNFAEENDYTFFNLREQTGFLRTLMIRTASTGEIMVVIAFAFEDQKKREALLDNLIDRFPAITSLMYVINEKRNDSFEGLKVLPYHGTPFIIEQMESLLFTIGPKSFFQTNSDQAHRLYSIVRDFASLTGNELVYDLYTGTGTIALFLSRYAKEVIGIEYVEEAVADARENAKANQINNCHFYAGDMKEVLNRDFLDRHGTPDVMILDPPRMGIHPQVISVIIESSPSKIIYVSCNPATQARDINLLSTRYTIQSIQPIDMFPHTHHVENVVLLQKTSA